MTYILLDSNIYLHFMAFDTLPWKEIVNVNDEVTILLPMQVLRKLEKKKDDSNHFQSQNQVDLVLVSWDTPMLLKAKQSNLSYVNMIR